MMSPDNNDKRGPGRANSVVDLTDPDFLNWPKSFEGKIFLKGSKAEGYHLRENKPIPVIAAENAARHKASLKGRVEALEIQVASLIQALKK